MKRNKALFQHALILLVTLIVTAWLAGELFKPKFRNDNYWPLDVTYESFYEMQKNSVDVIFLGSSHAISAFSPQMLYDATGIRGFNLSSEEQSLLVSYYWLKEALRTQKPQAVVLDTVVCFPFMDTPYNCNEPSIRKAIDPMRWSSVKAEAVSAIGALDAKETFLSYLFPIIRYHARWSDLSLDDIRFWPPQNTSLKGYAVLSEDSNITDYEPYPVQQNAEPAGMQNVMRNYLEDICTLCRENGIELILVSTPYVESSPQTHQAAAEFAEQQNIQYIDFNETDNYQAMNFDFAHDMADAGHANTFGAEKLTAFIGNKLKELGISGTSDEQYIQSRAYCRRQVKNANLYRIDSLQEYLASIDRDDYLIFVSGSEDCGEPLGIADEKPFAALLEAENSSVSTSMLKGYRFSENLRYAIVPGNENGTVKVHDVTYERTAEGLQIVLLDREKGYVIDHSVFDRNGQRIQ